jgi:hypothetical protein
MAKSYQKKQEWDATERNLTLVHKTALRSRQLGDTGQPEVAHEVIAARIIAAAGLGERDPVRLLEAVFSKPG